MLAVVVSLQYSLLCDVVHPPRLCAWARRVSTRSEPMSKLASKRKVGEEGYLEASSPTLYAGEGPIEDHVNVGGPSKRNSPIKITTWSFRCCYNSRGDQTAGINALQTVSPMLRKSLPD